MAFLSSNHSTTSILLDIPTTTDIEVAESIATNLASQLHGDIKLSTVSDTLDYWHFAILTPDSAKRIQAVSRYTTLNHGDTIIGLGSYLS